LATGQRALEGLVLIERLRNTLHGCRVLVTGHTGFKGSWLVAWLHRLGARVAGFALPPPTRPSNFDVSGIQRLLDAHFVGDIRDSAALAEVFDRADPQVVFHLAAQAIVLEGYRDPLATFDVNTLGTARLLEVVRQRRHPCTVIVVTSDKCYDPRDPSVAHPEADPLGGADPYSASKGAAELVVSAYRASFFSDCRARGVAVRLASARAGNVIGGGDWAPERIIPDVIRALSQGEPVIVRNPLSIRPWQHVLEPLAGYLQLAAKLIIEDDAALCEAWNFGPRAGDEATVREVVERVIQHWGEGSWAEGSRGDEPTEAPVLRLNSEKATSRLGWSPIWDLDTAIQATVGWYRRWLGQVEGDGLAWTLADIEAYEAGLEAHHD
jgi:CDP-glucose 4,6-dehydratase